MRATCMAGVGLALAVGAIAGCHDSLQGPTGPANCSGPAVLGTLPVPLGAIATLTPIGNMGPPTHTLPTDHVGFYIRGTGIPLTSPVRMRVNRVVTTKYLVSSFRQGVTDYGVEATLCGGYGLVLGHIQTASAPLAAATGTNCQTYSTADETVQQCRRDNADFEIAEGENIGTVGAQSIGAFDLGIYDQDGSNYYVNPSRYSTKTLTAICPYDLFAPALKAQLYGLIGDGVFAASGEAPQCGAMSVDVAGTARGVWIRQGSPSGIMSDESNFAVLAPHPLFPVSKQTFSIGIAQLSATVGAGLPQYPTEPSGRINRQFRDVTGDGQVYCYVRSLTLATFSYLVSLDAGSVLSIRKVVHASGASPCSADPATWSMSGATRFVR